MTTPAGSVDEYLDAQPPEQRATLDRIREACLSVASPGTETISYGMPTYRLVNGRPVFFANWKRHVSLHAVPVFDPPLEDLVAGHRSGQDTVRFPWRAPVPIDLIRQVLAATAALPG